MEWVVTVDQVKSLAQELPHAIGVAKKKKKKKKKERKEKEM